MLLAMLSLDGVFKSCFGSNGLIFSSDAFLFMLLPCLRLSVAPPALISKLSGCFGASPSNKTSGSEIVDFSLSPL